MESVAFLDRVAKDLELDLRDPRTPDASEPGPEPTPSRHTSALDDPELNSRRKRCNVTTRARALSTGLLLYGTTAVFTLIYCGYVHQALLSTDPWIPDVLLTAPHANVIVSVCSTIFASLVAYLLADALQQMRWLLAARDGGVDLALFMVMGSATEWHAAGLISLKSWRSPATWVVGLVRVGLPLATIYYGAVLKCELYYVPLIYIAFPLADREI
jgi:hypothetical protein